MRTLILLTLVACSLIVMSCIGATGELDKNYIFHPDLIGPNENFNLLWQLSA